MRQNKNNTTHRAHTEFPGAQEPTAVSIVDMCILHPRMCMWQKNQQFVFMYMDYVQWGAHSTQFFQFKTYVFSFFIFFIISILISAIIDDQR